MTTDKNILKAISLLSDLTVDNVTDNDLDTLRELLGAHRQIVVRGEYK